MLSYRSLLENNFKNWDPEKYNWKYIDTLFNACSDYFKIWFNPKYVDIYENSFYLIYYAKGYFDLWWDKDKFDYKNYSYFLARELPEKFQIWWDKDKYNWQRVDALIYNCQKYINTWWDIKKVVEYADNEAINELLEFLPQKEIIKLKILRGL